MVEEKLAALVAQVHASVRKLETEAESSLRNARQVFGLWAMIDLKASAAFRQDSGDSKAFVRAETFMAAIETLTTAYSGGDGPEVFKTLGDGVLIRCTDLRPLFELSVVLDLLRRQWATAQASPFDYRLAVTSGSCARVTTGTSQDYLGRPLDRLARISAMKPSVADTVMIIESAVRQLGWPEIERTYPFAQMGPDLRLPIELVKPGEDPPFVCEVSINPNGANEFRDYFAELRRKYSPSQIPPSR